MMKVIILKLSKIVLRDFFHNCFSPVQSFTNLYSKILKPIRLLNVVHYNEIAKPFTFSVLAPAVLFAPNNPKSFLFCKPQSLNRCHLAQESLRVNISESRFITLWGSQPLHGQDLSQSKQSSPYLGPQALEVDFETCLSVHSNLQQSCYRYSNKCILNYISKFICLYIYAISSTVILFKELMPPNVFARARIFQSQNQVMRILFSFSKCINSDFRGIYLPRLRALLYAIPKLLSGKCKSQSFILLGILSWHPTN